MVEQSQLLSLKVAHLAPGAVLPVTHVDLTQSGVRVDGEDLWGDIQPLR